MQYTRMFKPWFMALYHLMYGIPQRSINLVAGKQLHCNHHFQTSRSLGSLSHRGAESRQCWTPGSNPSVWVQERAMPGHWDPVLLFWVKRSLFQVPRNQAWHIRAGRSGAQPLGPNPGGHGYARPSGSNPGAWGRERALQCSRA